MRRRVDDTARALGGEVIAGDPARLWDRAAIDSRAVAGGELFFALAGERTDGHRFVGDAFARGAAAAVVDREAAIGERGGPAGCLLRVADSYSALHALTRALRRDAPEVLVAVTGSSGKTTTKELLAAMCERRFRTARNPGNLNNLYGFPVSLLSIPDATEVMVAELGMSVAGELGAVSRLARPDGVVLTNVRPVHLASFPDLAAVAEAKAEVFEGLAPSGFVAANRDDPEVERVTRRWRDATGGRVVWFGSASGEAGVRARDVRPLARPVEEGVPGPVGSRFVLELGGEAVEVELPLHGRHNVDNAVAAAAAARELGVTGEEIREALAAAAPAAHRGAVHRLQEGVTLVDDSYNSNPDALARALAAAAELAGAAAGGGGRRRVAVLGDMLELGPEETRFHREAGERAARLGFSPLAGVGELARELVAAARQAGAEAAWLPDAEAAAGWAEETVRPGDLVLVKGSRGVGLEAVVERLLGPGQREREHAGRARAPSPAPPGKEREGEKEGGPG